MQHADTLTSSTRIMTVREAYDAAVNQLKSAGFDENEARTNGRVLLDHFVGHSHAHLVLADQTLNDYPKVFFDNVVKVRFGEPLAHVLRHRAFYGLDFRSDSRALIPRPETELLVEHVVQTFKNRDRVLVADLGTGSGCIAVSVAHALPQSRVHATDVSRDALELARENARLHTVENRVEFVEGQSGQWSLPLEREGFDGRFDCIVTNPPYISPRDINALPKQIKDFEPRTALDGGADGMDCYREIAPQCGTLLTRQGFLLAELGAGQFDAVRAIFERNHWTVAPPIFDFAGHKRVLRAAIG